MNTHQNNIAKLAKQARTYDKSSRSGSKFQNSVYQELKAYRGSAESLPGLKELDDATKGAAGDHGLDNFNRDDPVQVLVRTLNESTQQTLESINLIGELFFPSPVQLFRILLDSSTDSTSLCRS
jgi:hypothetical protein